MKSNWVKISRIRYFIDYLKNTITEFNIRTNYYKTKIMTVSRSPNSLKHDMQRTRNYTSEKSFM